MNHPNSSVIVPGYRAGSWTIDPARSSVTFAVRQLVGRLRGKVTDFDATIITGAEPTASTVTATLDLTSVDTGNAKRDVHLRGSKYLKTAAHPSVAYRSTGIERVDDRWVVNGVLTLHGTSSPTPLRLTAHDFSTDIDGVTTARFAAIARISRKDFGVTVPGAAGGFVVSDAVTVRLDILAVRTR